jgi:hypothetical protein
MEANAGAEAQLCFVPFTARLKSCPDTKHVVALERSAVAFFRSSATYPDDKAESGDSIGVGLRDAVIPINVEDDLLADHSL